jgi:hypothetical protein
MNNLDKVTKMIPRVPIIIKRFKGCLRLKLDPRVPSNKVIIVYSL